MPISWMCALASVLVVSGVSFAGVAALALNTQRQQQVIFLMVSLAVGAMFGDAFIHLLPEAFRTAESSPAISVSILAGLLAFFLLEKFLLWRHEHVPHYGDCIQPVGYVNVIAEGLHNLIDGLLIGASYLVSIPVGLATTIAVLLHEIPQEMGNVAILLHAGFGTTKALSMNFLSASLAIVGALLALTVGTYVTQLPAILLPFTAGGFIYIAGSDLVPELHKEREPIKSLQQMAAIGVGVGLMLLLLLLE
ncbi:MAG: ZIP family metal transporter [Candidatus Omnitrophica bacterium]|nr:ZIP family metal transporter [Candidatus Omnitrophota bacterium]